MILTCSSCGARNRAPAERLADGPRCAQCKARLATSHPLELSSTEDFDELTARSPRPVLVDFWAPWCGPCRAVAPELAKLAAERHGQLIVAKVNTDVLTEVAARLSISAIPTLVLFTEGRPVKRVSGAMRAPEITRAFGL